MEKIKVTIITVCLNCAATIRQTIESVLFQEYGNIEYILVDGGSSDGTLEIIKEFELAFNGKMKYISEKDEGLYDAMNKGIKMSSGNIISFLNGDDWYEKDAIARVVEYFDNPEVDMLFGRANIIGSNKIIGVWPADINEILYRMPCCHQAVFAKRELFTKIGAFNMKYIVCADYDWLLRVYNKGACIKCVQDVFVNFRVGGFNSQNKERMFAEHAKIVVLNAQTRGAHNVIPDMCKNMCKDREEELYQLACDYKLDYIKGLLDKDKKYYIWGTGDYGHRCFSLFKLMQIEIIGFVDSYKGEEYIEEYPVIFPEEINNDGVICISSIKYEEDILRQLSELGIRPERYFSYTKLRKKIIICEWENILGMEI